jgi:hypothetical protein
MVGNMVKGICGSWSWSAGTKVDLRMMIVMFGVNGIYD